MGDSSGALPGIAFHLNRVFHLIWVFRARAFFFKSKQIIPAKSILQSAFLLAGLMTVKMKRELLLRLTLFNKTVFISTCAPENLILNTFIIKKLQQFYVENYKTAVNSWLKKLGL